MEFSRATEMIRDLIVKRDGLILSENTLNEQQILIKLRDFIKGNCIEEGYHLVEEVDDIFGVGDLNIEELYYLYHYGKLNDEFTGSDRARIDCLIYEDMYNLLYSISPNGYYFGNIDGDDTCIGFFEYDEEWED